VVWSGVAACFAIAMSLRYEKVFLELAPKAVVYGVMATLWVAFFLPVIVVFARPLRDRSRGVPAEV
jgi:uncharacterized membrane protein YhaH (DUF805 family)